ncbi:MAG: hypothetical protein AB1540_16995, partial [Bdellovibrionota bacterium]
MVFTGPTKFAVGVMFALLFIFNSLFAFDAFAVPTRDELYRSDRLKVVVFKDSQDASIFWYLPPIKLYENEGKVVYYKRAKGKKVNFYFYILPYMTDDLTHLLSGEIPGLQNRSQLKPVIAKQFGIQVKQFDVVSPGDQLTDFHYLNQPQMIQVSVPESDAEEFEFFINNKPGIQANILFHYESERMDKYLNIELSHKEVYNAMNIGATGRYRFTAAEIESGITSYLSKKYFNIKSKGDLSIPDVIKKVITECFTPYEKGKKKKDDGYWGDWDDDEYDDDEGDDDDGLFQSGQVSTAKVEARNNRELLESLEVNASELVEAGRDFGSNMLDGDGEDEQQDDDFGEPSGKRKKPKVPVSVEFTFKKDLANSDKKFVYQQQHFT